METLGSVVAIKRAQLGMSQATLAAKLRKLGQPYTRQLVANLEGERIARQPSDEKIRALGTVLDIPFDDLRVLPVSEFSQDNHQFVDGLEISGLLQKVVSSKKKITFAELKLLCVAYYYKGKSREAIPIGWEDAV